MALKIVYKICCGIDVHKTFVVACKNFMGSDPGTSLPITNFYSTVTLFARFLGLSTSRPLATDT